MAVTCFSAFKFEGKAQTLANLAPLLTRSAVLPLARFRVEEWLNDPVGVKLRICELPGAETLIVRSSCKSEDQAGHSGAGAYESVADVRGEEMLIKAIDRVIASYQPGHPDDEVLVQAMAQNVQACGVVMTREPETGLPYYVVNYTTGSGTDGVTAGNERVLSWIAAKRQASAAPDVLQGLLPMVAEIEMLTGLDALDIEFAITADGPLLFQVRPMTAIAGSVNDGEFCSALQQEIADLQKLCQETGLPDSEKYARFGLMPDWNPAEIIGVKPRPLAYDLYKALITDLNWASARFRYGYRDMRGNKLMQSIGGSPYISIPLSVESFVPASMPQNVVSAVVASSCRHLAHHPELHDKIEFAIIPTCFTPSLTLTSAAQLPALRALSEEQTALYLSQLRKLTENMISEDGPFYNDLRLTPRIEQTLNELKNSPDVDADPLQHFRAALSSASVVGEMFAGAARAAFVATSILKSLEAEGVTPTGYTDTFLARAKTVGQELSDDFILLERQSFLQKHGHIRPGTYDIRIARYDESPETYFDWSQPPVRQIKTEEKPATSSDLNLRIQKVFYQSGLDIHVKQFLAFCISAVEAREKVKYLYGAFVSEVLRALTLWGRQHRIDRETLSFTSLALFGKEETCTTRHVRESAADNMLRWEAAQGIRPPSIICASVDLQSHGVTVAKPNFITRERAEAPVRLLQPGQPQGHDLAGAIVLIENADPGFDWIFTRNISGFITAYGGENSHMSIRAREFGIPAVIGVGEQQLQRYARAQRLLMDCAANRIEILA